jgi:hypothetical protein
MDRADWLGMGVFRSSSVVVIRACSIVWRYLGSRSGPRK